MLLQKLKNKGALFIEYALILAFVVVTGLVFVANDGLKGSVNSIFTSASKLLGLAANPTEKTTLDKVIDDLRGIGKIEYSGTNKFLVASYKDLDSYNNDKSKEMSAYVQSILDNIQWGDVEPESWRLVNSDPDGNGNMSLFYSGENWNDYTNKLAPCIVTNIDKNGNITYSVAAVGSLKSGVGGDNRLLIKNDKTSNTLYAYGNVPCGYYVNFDSKGNIKDSSGNITKGGATIGSANSTTNRAEAELAYKQLVLELKPK